jgi:hypothetical protein
MGENVPYTSYLSQKEHRFIEKCYFCDDLKLLKNIFCVQAQGVKTQPLKQILTSTLHVSKRGAIPHVPPCWIFIPVSTESERSFELDQSVIRPRIEPISIMWPALYHFKEQQPVGGSARNRTLDTLPLHKIHFPSKITKHFVASLLSSTGFHYIFI